MAEIKLEHVSFSYGEGSNAFEALHDVNLTIADGEFVCVIGRSGCGKSTLLRLLSGLQHPTAGRVSIGGREVLEPSTQTAVVFQNYTLFPWMRVRENVEFGIAQANKALSREEVRGRAEEFLAKVEMDTGMHKYPCQLSGGMKQRVAIARALAMDSDILLMDEPFGALDARTRRSLRRLLEQLWMNGEKRRTVVMVTHDIREAAKMADRIVFMTPGRIEEVIESRLPRPRNPIDTRYTCDLEDLQKKLSGLFYRSAAEVETDED